MLRQFFCKVTVCDFINYTFCQRNHCCITEKRHCRNRRISQSYSKLLCSVNSYHSYVRIKFFDSSNCFKMLSIGNSNRCLLLILRNMVQIIRLTVIQFRIVMISISMKYFPRHSTIIGVRSQSLHPSPHSAILEVSR